MTDVLQRLRDDLDEYLASRLKEFEEQDAVSLEVYYRVSPEFIAAIRQQRLEIAQLRNAAHRLAEALAKRCLSDANEALDDKQVWPAGQEWDDLVGTSHSIFRHRAWEEAGLSVDAMRSLLFGKYGMAKE